MKRQNKKPPKIAEWLLKTIANKNNNSAIIGDFEEEYYFKVETKGVVFAKLWYWSLIFISLPSFIVNNFYWDISMFKNYFITALRNIRKHKSYSIINITGLTIGMTCFILIALYIQHELSYDKFHKNSDQIYRIVKKMENTYRGNDMSSTTPAPLAEILKSDYPQIDKVTRLRWENSPLFQCKENSFLEDKIFYVDPEFLEIFSFPLISGDPQTVLDKPYSIIFTEKMAHKYFGKENPVGKTIKVNQKHDYIITGVMKNVPSNSHIHFNFIASFNTLYKQRDTEDQRHSMHWNAAGFFTYVKLKGNVSSQALEPSFVEVVKKYKRPNSKIRYLLQPIEQIHLHQNWSYKIEDNGDIRYIYLFAAIGFFILLIACFNYVNISTAGSVKRAKEVGLRKFVGANRMQLLKQFLSESLIFSFLSFCLAILIVELVLPTFRSFIDKNIQASIFSDIKMLSSLLGILLVTGFFAGAYPAFFISAFQPSQIFKGVAKRNSKSFIGLRNVLVIFQFFISAILIICTLTVYNQLHYMKNKKLGYKNDHIVTTKVSDEHLQKDYDSFFSELSSNHNIIDISASRNLPHSIGNRSNVDWDGRKNNELSLMSGFRADHRFAYLYDIPVIQGLNYSKENDSSVKSCFLLNRTAFEALGWESAIGRRFEWNDTWKENGQIIGIVDDFHFFPLHHKIEPLAIELVGSHLKDWEANYFSIKIRSNNISETLDFIEKKWKQHSQYPFDFQFYDTQLDKIYKTEQKLGQFFNLFTIIAIFIACLGLYGLISFSIEQRIKEIGIRKILGASISKIINLLTKETAVCILVANLVAWPIAWYAMHKWLQDFAYRVDLSWWIFALSGAIALLIALLTISWQAIKAARANPINSLKYE